MNQYDRSGSADPDPVKTDRTFGDPAKQASKNRFSSIAISVTPDYNRYFSHDMAIVSSRFSGHSDPFTGYAFAPTIRYYLHRLSYDNETILMALGNISPIFIIMPSRPVFES